MRTRQRSRAVARRLFVAIAAITAFVVVRDRVIVRNRARYGPPPLAMAPSADTA